jgi:putative phosphoribosyl transferase
MQGTGMKTTLARIDADGREGQIRLPVQAPGLVVFAHGSGSSRLSPRNIHVADRLAAAGLGSLLFDLLTDAEAQDRRNVFDIPLLAARVASAVDWVGVQTWSRSMSIGLFGASTGAAAALVAATLRPETVRAIVSRGGRPDLAGESLSQVRAPTLLIVGGEDREVLALNRQAARQLTCPHRLVVVDGATHLFEEEGTLAAAIGLAEKWFLAHLAEQDPAS